MQTIYLIVGKKIVAAQARIVGRIAEVATPSGIVERTRWFNTEFEAKVALSTLKQKAAA